MRHERRGADVIEATEAAASAGTDHMQEVASVTLHVKAASWYMGANIPGKPRLFLPYIGGVGPYRDLCAAVAASGYEGFTMSGRCLPGGRPPTPPDEPVREKGDGDGNRSADGRAA